VKTDNKLWLVGVVLFATTLGVFTGSARGAAPSAAPRCPLTQGNVGDSFYKPNAPVRSHVGTGFTLTGVVRSGIDCSAISGAHVEFWLRGPNGQYDDVHRGTAITDANGRYHFESNFPGGDGGFMPHIHLRVAVPGFRTLVTVYLPRAGDTTGMYDLVLEPEV
jgi:protocatechuate 3,4-dioxygenase beta subunit